MKKFFLIPVMLLILQMAHGQTNIGISAITSTPQTVAYQDTISYSVAVKNYGPDTLNSTITLNIGIWDTSMTYVSIIRQDSVSLSNVLNFLPGDSIWVFGQDMVVPQSFRIGTSVVVIWPIATGHNTLDSISYEVVVQSGVRVLEVVKEEERGVYPNPAKDRITISTGQDVEQVRILNAAGQMLLGRSGAGNIDISSLSPGIYFAEITLGDGSKKVYRVIRQD